MEGLQNALMPNRVGKFQHCGQQRRLHRYENAGAMEDETVHDAPRGAAASGYRVLQRAQGCVLLELTAEVAEEVEGWS